VTDFGALRILVVDDDPMMVNLLSRVLIRAGVPAPTSANDGRAALERLDATPIDLVFCDIDMPGMDGIEFLRHLRNRTAPPAVVVLSSTPGVIRESVEKLGLAHRLRILGSLPKPASVDSVQDMLVRFVSQPMADQSVAGNDFTPTTEEVLALLATAIEIDYQPIHDTVTGRVVALEALARLRHPTRGLIGPTIFIPVCERAGAATQLLRTVLTSSLRLLAELHAEGYENLVMAVNMSPADLTTADLVAEISAAVDNAGVPPARVVLELTESLALHDTTLPTEILTRLRVRGMGLAADDFGTGYASLKQLGRLPFTELKIDQTFVRGAHLDERKRTMLASTIQLAHDMGLATVAEGVESQAEFSLIRELRCDYVQGFHLSRPMSVPQLRDFLTANFADSSTIAP